MTACGGSFYDNDTLTSCVTLINGEWTNKITLNEKRAEHVSWLRPDGKIQLMTSHGALIDDKKSTEVVDLEAGTSEPGFDLKYPPPYP